MQQDYSNEISVISYWLKSHKEGIAIERLIDNDINTINLAKNHGYIHSTHVSYDGKINNYLEYISIH